MARKSFLLIALIVLYTSGMGQNRYTDSLKKVLKQHPREDTVRVSILNLLAFEKHFSDPFQAISYADESRRISINIRYGKGIALSHRFTGLAYWSQANYAQALDSFLKGLSIADSLQLKQIKADITGNIGLVYNGMGNSLEALKSFQASLELQRESKNTRREVIMLNNIGDCHVAQGEYDKALNAYSESLALGKPINFLVETNSRNIGNVYEIKGDLNTAMDFYRAAKELDDVLKEKREMTLIRKSMASVYLKQGHADKAEQLALEAIKIAKDGNYRAPLRDTYFLLSKITEARGKANESLLYYKTAVAYKDSIQNLDEASRISSLRLDYEMQKKQFEIDKLQTQTQLDKKDIRFKNTLLISGVVVFALILFTLYHVISNYQFQRKLNQLLKEKNGEILRQQRELAQLNEEVVSQRDRLMEQNQEIEKVNHKMTEVNENLESLIALRTAVLEEQNQRLTEYAFMNAHKLRAPLASIMGLVSLLHMDHNKDEHSIILSHLKKSSDDLDEVVRDINIILQEGLDVYSVPEKTKGLKTD